MELNLFDYDAGLSVFLGGAGVRQRPPPCGQQAAALCRTSKVRLRQQGPQPKQPVARIPPSKPGRWGSSFTGRRCRRGQRWVYNGCGAAAAASTRPHRPPPAHPSIISTAAADTSTASGLHAEREAEFPPVCRHTPAPRQPPPSPLPHHFQLVPSRLQSAAPHAGGCGCG